MLPPGPWACGAESGDCAERTKDGTEYRVIRSPGEDGAEQRERGKPNKSAYGLGVHFARSTDEMMGAS